MASYRHHRRRKDKDNKPKTKSRRASRKNDDEELAAEPTTTSVHDVPDHLLELILLRLRSSACLLPAAAACKRWRRLISATDFLPRCLHARSCVSGHYHAFDPDWVADYGSPPVTGNPVFVPSTPSSLAIVDRRRFIGMSGFRLVAVLHEDHVSEEGRAMPVACVFSLGSDGGGWSVLPNESTNSAAVSLPWVIERTSFAGRANGCLYWVIEEDDATAASRAMLVFDDTAMEFSRVPLLMPAVNEGDDSNDHYDRWSFRVIGGGEDDGGALRVVRLVRNELTVLARRRHGSDDADEWVVEGTVRLREATLGLPGHEESFFQRNAMVVAAHEEYVIVTPQEKTWLFSVDLKTMEVERDHERNRYAGPAFPSELPWPPSFIACATSKRGSLAGAGDHAAE